MDHSHPLVVAALNDFRQNPGKAEDSIGHYIDHPTRLSTLAEKIKAGDLVEARRIIAERGATCFLMENEEALFTAFMIHFDPAAVK